MRLRDLPDRLRRYAIDAHGVGLVSMRLGGGRAEKDDKIDLAVGVVLKKKVGEPIRKGEALAELHARTEAAASAEAASLAACFGISQTPVQRDPFIKGVVR